VNRTEEWYAVAESEGPRTGTYDGVEMTKYVMCIMRVIRCCVSKNAQEDWEVDFGWLLMAVTIQETATWMETKHEDGNAQAKRAGKRQVYVTQQACIREITGAPQCASFQKVK
jgi:hypothetical protein